LDPLVETESWKNRTNATVNRVFDILWRQLRFNDEQPNTSNSALIVSVDRFGVMRPTKLRVKQHLTDAQEGNCEQDAIVDRPDWRTSRNWLHWDQNPWSNPLFFGVQGLLALSDGASSSGGFVTVPGFHHEFANWGEQHPEGSLPKRTAATVPFPVPLDDAMQSRRVKVLVPRGGLLAWDSRMPHENFPNEDSSWRLAQYVTCKRLCGDVLANRVQAWCTGIRTGLVSVDFARRFTVEEQTRLGMASSLQDREELEQALKEGESLSEQAREAAAWLRRAYRLKQTAMTPNELMEARTLFQKAFAVNSRLKEPMQRVAAAENSYLPFWIL